MSIDKEKFEKSGLKIDHERILTYSGLVCPLDCKYCFSEELNQGQSKSTVYLSESQFDLLKQLPEEIELIMLGCDTEFFQHRENSIEILEKLSDLGKDISVITKFSLPDSFIEKLSDINARLKQRGNSLTFSETITCLDSAKEWEPKAPEPEKRIKTLKLAHEKEINTLLAIRPLLPVASEEELRRLINLTKSYISGYYSGPLYLKDLNHPLLKGVDPKELKTEQLQPHWMPRGNVFYKIEKEGQMDLLKNIIQESGKPFFEGAAEAIKYLKTHEKY